MFIVDDEIKIKTMEYKDIEINLLNVKLQNCKEQENENAEK